MNPDNCLVEITNSSGRFLYPILEVTSDHIQLRDRKIVPDANSWGISGDQIPHTVRLIQFPVDLTKVKAELLFDLLSYFMLCPDEDFWRFRLSREYGDLILENRPADISAQTQYLQLWKIQKILDSPLFNRNYSDLETRLPLDWITDKDRIDLIMTIPLNLLLKYQDLRSRLARSRKINVLNWLRETYPMY